MSKGFCCPSCGSLWTEVLDVRHCGEGRRIRRRRVCKVDDCQHKFSTIEMTMQDVEALRRLSPEAYDARKLRDALGTIQGFFDAVLLKDTKS